LLADNRALGHVEFASVRQHKDAIRRVVTSREAHVRQHGLDLEFSLPGGNWTPDAHDFLVAYRHLLDGDSEITSRLRLYAQAFSGHQLLTMSPGCGKQSVNEIDEYYDDRLREILRVPSEWVARWRAIVAQCPDRFRFRPQPILGEVGWLVDGVIVNHDTYAYQERLNLLHESGLLTWLERREQRTGQVRILEIGGGYGALAAALKRAFPLSSYTICDLPESLLFSGCYLRVARPDCAHLTYETAQDVVAPQPFGFQYLPNFLFPALVGAGATYDLVVNTLSFSEMTAHQVRTYGEGISSLIGQGGVLFEQNQDNRHMGLCYCKDHLAESFPHRRTVRSRTVRQVENGITDLWSNFALDGTLGAQLDPTPAVDRISTGDRPLLRKQDVKGFNIVEIGGNFFALAQSIGPVDFHQTSEREWNEWIVAGRCFVGSSFEAAMAFASSQRKAGVEQAA